jgi:hypothetical protein
MAHPFTQGDDRWPSPVLAGSLGDLRVDPPASRSPRFDIVASEPRQYAVPDLSQADFPRSAAA